MNEERKTLEERAQMTDLERLRHSASHVLATAILKIWPEAQFAAGPHVMRTGNIGAFKVTSVASAYYKGDEKNPQLQRVYGTAFKTKKELDDYFAMLEEAKKRDHRKLGRELELFVFDDDVGPGLPMFLPRGAVIAEELEKLAKETEFAAGYQRVRTPHIARESLYKKSGHLPYYAESMFPPMELTEDGKDLEAKQQRFEELKAIVDAKQESPELYTEFKQLQHELLESDNYYHKAMNC